MKKTNKAHTATVNRIARRYAAIVGVVEGVDIRGPGLSIVVETQATLRRGLRQLRALSGQVYLAMTNKEGVAEALQLTAGTDIGVMDPQGNILKHCSRQVVPTSTDSTTAQPNGAELAAAG